MMVVVVVVVVEFILVHHELVRGLWLVRVWGRVEQR